MRSLEEWTRYLEQQEQTLQQNKSPEKEPEKPEQKPQQTAHQVAPVVPDVQRRVETPVPPPTQTPETVITTTPPVEELPAPEPSASPQKTASAVKAVKPRKTARPDKIKEVVHARKKLLETDGGQQEIAQRYYGGFKETREELLSRLLDPQISLEDAARILNVCPTTVRRYTNKGVLRHFRTAGNQRRFRLSDVLEFLESQMSGVEVAD